MKKKIRLKRVQSLHPVSQMHHRTMWAEGSPPYPTDADVLSFYCPSWSQLCCLQNQTPPLVSLSLSLSSLHALHHPSSLHLSWNTAGGWSFVNVTNHFYRPRTSASSSQCFITLLIFQSHLWLDLVNKIDRQARSQSLWDVASLQTTDWLREPLPLLRGGGGWGWVGGRFPWQPPWQQLHGHDCCETVDSKFAHAGNKQPLLSQLSSSLQSQSAHPLTYIHTG